MGKRKPNCEKCNGDRLVRNGRCSHTGVQRFKCADCGYRPSHPGKQSVGRFASKDLRGVTRYVITSAQNDTPVHGGFLSALKHYCRQRDAQLLVLPVVYKNPDLFHQGANAGYSWPHEVTPYLLDRDLSLHKHLTVMGSVKIAATSPNPLGQLDSLTGMKSAIFGHAQVQMRMVATPRNELPKMLHTTGSVSRKNYGSSQLAKRAAFHHSLGAVVIETKGDRFYPRELLGDRDGSFYDIDGRHNPDGSFIPFSETHRCPGLVLGDEHVPFTSPDVIAATFGPGGMVEALRPEVLVRHDVVDCFFGSHHHEGNILLKAKKAHTGMDSAERELMALKAHLEATTPEGTISAIAQSNHHDHLRQWLNRFSADRDPRNALFAWELLGNIAKAIKTGEDSDPMRVWLRANLRADILERVEFLDPNTPRIIAGIEVEQHGDRGPNGARGGAGYPRLNRKMIAGHTHSSRIEKGCCWVGVSAPDMAYAVGLSSWMTTHCVIYPSGKRSLLHMLGRHWRL